MQKRSFETICYFIFMLAGIVSLIDLFDGRSLINHLGIIIGSSIIIIFSLIMLIKKHK